MITKPPPFGLIHGASWLTPQGEVLPVPSFHEEWIRQNPELAQGAHNVCELVLRTGWVSVALFDGGYLELLVSSRGDPGIASLLREFLSRNSENWTRALIMSMDQEGYTLLAAEDLVEGRRFEELLSKTI